MLKRKQSLLQWSNLCERAPGPKLLPDHQEAHRPVGDPQETGQEQHSPLLHRRAVRRRRPADVQELRHVQLRKFVKGSLETEWISCFNLISSVIELFLLRRPWE